MKSDTRRHRIYPLALFVILACGGGYWVASQLPPGDWYLAAATPSWQPAAWLVVSSWLLASLSSALAAWLIWRRRSLPASGPGLFMWMLQLVLAAGWWWVSFDLHRPGWALGGVLLLWLILAMTIMLFHGTRRLAAWLMVPWLVWVTVAAVLNYEFWRLNGGGLFQ